MTYSHEKLNAVIFGTSGVLKSTILTQAAVRLARQMDGFRIVAICDTGKKAPSNAIHRSTGIIAKHLLAALFDRKSPGFFKREMLVDLNSIAKTNGISLLTPLDGNINHPEFISHLGDEIKPNLALSFGCSQVFGQELLNLFSIAVNNHDGILPDYRGWSTTQWSVYHGEVRTGYTYHYLTRQIDAGGVLSCGSLQVGDQTIQTLLYQKAKQAATQLEGVIRAVADGAPGTPQTGESRYFTKQDYKRITTVQEPAKLSWHELNRRLRAFGVLRLHLHGRLHPVTKLKRCKPGKKLAWSFVTADGVLAAATRFAHLPFWLYRLSRRGLGGRS